ncbi:MAG: hypothetical protein DRI93_07275 [Aquificota bacterium]|nr:MAG: hypothetical protein DRI93_07275 [Aquificota bacterium]
MGEKELRYYSVKEAAEILGVSERTVRNYIVKGKIRAKRFGKARKVYRLNEEQLERLKELKAGKDVGISRYVEKTIAESQLDKGRLSEDIGELRGAINRVFWVLVGLWGTMVIGFIALLLVK